MEGVTVFMGMALLTLLMFKRNFSRVVIKYSNRKSKKIPPDPDVCW